MSFSKSCVIFLIWLFSRPITVCTEHFFLFMLHFEIDWNVFLRLKLISSRFDVAYLPKNQCCIFCETTIGTLKSCVKLCTESIAIVKFFEKPQNMKWKKIQIKKFGILHMQIVKKNSSFQIFMKNIRNIKVSVKKSTWLLYAYI